MSAYTPKRVNRDLHWITDIIGTRNEWKRVICRDLYRLCAWWRRNGWGFVLAGIVIGLGTATILKIAEIYEPNPHVPFLPAISAVRG